MTTVILRAATAPAEDTIATSSPTLARLTQILSERRVDTPFYVDPITYEAAESEMKEILLKRGYSEIVPANLQQRNFRLFGVPIVREDD